VVWPSILRLSSNSNISACDQNAAILPARHAPRQERKAPVKQHPPPEDIIVLSSDSEQSRAQSESSASSVRSRRKAINTLSSVLSARSKVRRSVKRLFGPQLPVT
jgi:G2/mitotic-specific cyclin-B, other